ncbi:hypothetical protein AgCh_015624 [Apium graveolens]
MSDIGSKLESFLNAYLPLEFIAKILVGYGSGKDLLVSRGGSCPNGCCNVLKARTNVALKKTSRHHNESAALTIAQTAAPALVQKSLEDGVSDKPTVKAFFSANASAHASRKSSPRVNNEAVQKADAALKGFDPLRATNVSARLDAQQKKLNLPILLTTTIGSFPQIIELRRVLREYKAKKISEEDYVGAIKEEISKVVKLQEELDIDVLVHEPEVLSVCPLYIAVMVWFGAAERGIPVTRIISRMTLQRIMATAVGDDIILNGSNVVDFEDDGKKLKSDLLSYPRKRVMMSGSKYESMKIFILKKADYFTWRLKILMFLKAIDDTYVDIIKTGPLYPMGTVAMTSDAPELYFKKEKSKWTYPEKASMPKDAKVRNILHNSLVNVKSNRVIACKTAKETWDALET